MKKLASFNRVLGPKKINTSNENLLSEKEKDTKLVDITLGQWMKSKQAPDMETSCIQDFFENENTSLYNETVDFYTHSILQYVMTLFFEEKSGFEKVKDFYIKDGITVIQAKKTKIDCEKSKTFDAYSEAYVFYKHKDGRKLCVRIDKNYYSNGKYYYEVYSDGAEKNNWMEEWTKCAKEHNFFRNQKIDADGLFLNLNNSMEWADVILKDETKKIIDSNVKNLFSVNDILIKNKIPLKRGVVFSGSPGCGKTTICKILAKEMPMTVLYVLPSHIQNVADINRICGIAKDLSPTLLIIEDIDYLTQDREEEGGNGWLSIELMNRLDGIQEMNNIITIATTNMIKKIEKAIKNRPGRFDRVITIDNPDDDCRMRMFKKFTENYNVDEKFDFAKIVRKTDGMSGAYIKDLCITGAVMAIHGGSLDGNQKVILKTEHMLDAIKEIEDKDYSSYREYTPKKSKGMGFSAYTGDDDDD